MSKIVYVCHYGTEKNPRHTSPAGVTLADYVIDCISQLGQEVTVFSPAQAISGCEVHRQTEALNDKVTAIFMKSFKTYGRKNLPMRFIQKIKRERELERELESLIEDGDTVIVYHSLSLMSVISKLRKKKSFKLILQVAEIYADVLENKRLRKREVAFIKGADRYIFISGLLQQSLEIESERAIVCSGAYNTSQVEREPVNDGKTHIVYAGTLDTTKGGAYFAVTCARYLNENYAIHILGFGSEEQKKQLNLLIKETQENTRCAISYDGCLGGNEYRHFLQGCHIGLSTQNPQGAYNDTSFPSKILVYLSNGLRVVSVKIPAIEKSPVGQAMYFYKEQSPQEIANAIMSANLNREYDGAGIIAKLDKEFRIAIDKLIK